MSTELLALHDKHIESTDWLEEIDLPVAVTFTEFMESSEGRDAIIFPPTFAVRNSPHPYQIDDLKHEGEVNTCLIDSVGSQANRMEPCFKRAPLSSLVPQVTVALRTKVDDEDKTVMVNLLDIGHRIADGTVRFSALRDDVTDAVKALMNGANAEPLAKLAPTSLIFGFWDSRPNTTMFKYGRLLSSTIRASNVSPVKRSAQFNPAFDPSLIGLADELSENAEAGQVADEDASGKSGDGKDPLSKLGLRAAPATGTHGGVRVFGDIVRRTQINLVSLRALAVTRNGGNGDASEIDAGATLRLRRYVFGLALVAAQCQSHYALREGCLLVRSKEPEVRLVFPDGRRVDFDWDLKRAIAYAWEAAAAFGVGPGKTVAFETHKIKPELDKLKDKKKPGKGGR